MRTWISLLVIGFSIVALGSGYLSGSTSMAPASTLRRLSPASPADFRTPAPPPLARSLHGAHSFDAGAGALPAFDEDAVLAGSPRSGNLADDAAVALVIEHAGRSLQIESGFLELPVPVTVAIDPKADDAKAVAAYAAERGKTVYAEVNLTGAADAGSLRKRIADLRAALPALSGLAVRFREEDQPHQAAVLAQALRTENLSVLDITGVGNAARHRLRAAHIRSRRRDVTIDERDDPPYVAFMLAQAVGIARERGTAVIVTHPYPGSLSVLEHTIDTARQVGITFADL